MAMQGHLGDMSVADLIQHACQDGKTARLRMDHLGRTAEIYFDGGQVVHAALGDLSGETAVYQALAWKEGDFQLEADVQSPARSIERSYASLLFEGARRIDEGGAQIDRELQAAMANPGDGRVAARAAGGGDLVASLVKIEGVEGAVLVAEDGVVVGHSMEGDSEKEGAVAAFVGAAALQAGASMGLGAFKRAAVGIATGSLLVLKHGDLFIGLLLKEGASPALVAGRAETVLGEGS
jgi:predicted regulator of Ras-like GTPase activity (Roadblock/LC7/MglB family)